MPEHLGKNVHNKQQYIYIYIHTYIIYIHNIHTILIASPSRYYHITTLRWVARFHKVFLSKLTRPLVLLLQFRNASFIRELIKQHNQTSKTNRNVFVTWNCHFIATKNGGSLNCVFFENLHFIRPPVFLLPIFKSEILIN